jgi:hypothetical protein
MANLTGLLFNESHSTVNFKTLRDAGAVGTYYLQENVATAFMCGSGDSNELYDYYYNTKVYFGR